MKASEYFDLPLEADDSCLYQSCGSDKYVARFDTQEQAQIAANHINHADALADALEVLISDNITMGRWLSDNYWNAEESENCKKARKALAAYRGAK